MYNDVSVKVRLPRSSETPVPSNRIITLVFKGRPESNQSMVADLTISAAKDLLAQLASRSKDWKKGKKMLPVSHNSAEIKVHDMTQFTEKLNSWLAGCQKKIVDHNKSQGYVLPDEQLTLEPGKKYIRVVSNSYDWVDFMDHSKGTVQSQHGKSCWAFINSENGDVLKPDGYKRPARHSRGNIFDEHNGLSRVTSYGPECLRG